MRSNLIYSLSEIAEIYDGPHATPKKLEEGDAIFLSISSIEDGRLNLEKSSFISEDDFVKWTRRVTPQAGDVVFSYETKIGEASIIPEGLRCCLGRRMGLLRAKQDKVLPQYLLYAYLSPAFQEVIREKTIHGSTTDRISIKEMPSFNIQIPDITTQKKVIQVLNSIDSKLYKNTEINQTLEKISQALFKSWFVDFEPVKAKIAVLEAGGSQEEATLAAMTAISGKNADSLVVFEREQPEKYAELKTTAELFPSAMQASELGAVPVGWSSQRLSNIATLHYGKALKKTERIDGPYPVYGSGGITGYHNSYLVEGPSIIVGRKGSIGTVYWEDGEFHPIDTVYYVTKKEGIPLSYLYYLIKTLNLPSMNTDAAVPGLNRDNVYRLEVLQPTQSILNRFDNNISTIRNGIQKNNTTIVSLVDLRDTLLPKLLSGEITLPEAEASVKDAEHV
ncbi:EcoKI restriction-modification system protein HsdS [Serratia rubidaea]|uniref:EcoKI restriction-modification system protein HsdS n=1 Tax=Serratia rubidaea TaxID=61652 RepID=A0A4U9H7S5_SERRU|nr:restriction endonuclease subunit S [Serratia rubidaea]QPR65062.1 restriction endonuclease subunit S [Serratia rubidaea]CAI0982955.1 EcoKI restriction-modification system protein HsdS [Serratia rubidaea]CAI1790323.1 EcoKI restriction-modification system protein HsdS [Serratia rubidaea]VTP59670.1 EcoKI restriction-modification system protein HsdS [Serratia rubidaea]HAY0637850.1 restriction endonuclease subunit S [Serratia rubidaea]